MTDPSTPSLRSTPLAARHRALGARMVPFAGWEMPVEYSGIIDEHLAVRTRAGLFDVSHMGQVEIAGRDALRTVQALACNDASRLQVGQAQYSALLTEQGTFIDDILVYRLASSHFLLVVNAAHAARDVAWLLEQAPRFGEAAIVDSSARYALLALQGPAAMDVLQPLTGVPLGDVATYAFAHGEVAGARAMISRTGYSGEDGFEVFVPPASAAGVWQAMLDAGREADVRPCGLGARDTLRLEAAMRLCGQDMDESTTPLEAGLGWIVGWSKASFVGHEPLRAERERGPARRLVGFEMVDAGIARHGHTVSVGGVAGVVTSGTYAPYLKKAIGFTYVPATAAVPGTELEVDIRGRRARARVVPLPFYKRAR
ncbi:MAG: glycine cleavage system aminomethyltransferase GcvT [Vicinamibacterales bacterium]